MFERRKLLQKQSQGLRMMRDGMNVQIDSLKHRQEYYIEIEKMEAAKECEAMLRILYYWRKEADKALSGNLHF